MSALQKKLVKNRLPPMVPRSGAGDGPRKGFGRPRDFTPLTWDKYFENAKDITISEGNTFRVYTAGSSGPLLLLLHGGGYCGLTWALFTTSIMNMVECQVAALDLRGHGETVTTDNEDLSAETVSMDVGNVLAAMYPDGAPPPLVIIGHSMGGAIAVHAVHRSLIPSCIGLIVIDVVEGTAMDALQSMQSFLGSRPNSFLSLEKAIEWCIRSGQVRNVESARVSMPGQLKSCSTDQPATTIVGGSVGEGQNAYQMPPRADSIPEEEEYDEDDKKNKTQDDISFNPSSIHTGDNINTGRDDLISKKRDRSLSVDSGSALFKAPSLPTESNTKYTWRIDLSNTERFWSGWFEGLSSLFLSTNEPKLLLLAGVDRLDRELTIGQMQGKFQMQVLPQCGHAVHEDVPDKVAEAISTFLVRHKFANPMSDFNRTFPGC